MDTKDLTNRSISEKFKAHGFCLLPNDFIGAFACWVAVQSWGRTVNIDKPLIAYKGHVLRFFKNPGVPQYFSLIEIEAINSENIFLSIPEIYELNDGRNFVDLSALSRNVTYMICRNSLLEND